MSGRLHQHALKPMGRSYTCDVCRKPGNGVAFACLNCNFDVCPKCYCGHSHGPSPGHHHRLTLTAHRERAICDICSNRIGALGISFYCTHCDHDECLSCYELLTQSRAENKPTQKTGSTRDPLKEHLALSLKEKGNGCFKQKNYDGALHYYSQAIALNPRDEVLYSNRSAAYYEIGEFKLALKEADTCISITSDFWKGYSRRGDALKGLERWEEAIKAYQNSLLLNPNNEKTLQALEFCRKSFYQRTEEIKRKEELENEKKREAERKKKELEERLKEEEQRKKQELEAKKRKEEEEKRTKEEEQERKRRASNRILVEFQEEKHALNQPVDSLDKLSSLIKEKFSISQPIKLLYFDFGFDDYVVLNSFSELPKEKAKLRVVFSAPTSTTASSLASSSNENVCSPANSFLKRLEDLSFSSTENPIFGLNDAPDTSLEEAIKYAQKGDENLGKKDLSGAIFLALRSANKKVENPETNPYHLTVEEIAAIHLYTQETPFYRIVNERLRNEQRQLLIPFFLYIKLLLKALYKLPSIKKTIYRGVSKDLPITFQKKQEFIWWSFTSTTSKIETLKDPTFFGFKGARIMFHIEIEDGVDISKYSANSIEEEILLLPGTFVEVKGVLEVADAKIIQMVQVPVPGLLDYKKK